MRLSVAAFISLLLGVTAIAVLSGGALAATATCADHPNQASAQKAKDTRDGDGDGIYCESLPCPCLKGGSTTPRSDPAPSSRSRRGDPAGCVRPRKVQNISFSATKYPTIRQHFRNAVAAGYPRVLSLHRTNASRRRARALRPFPTRRGYDRDEYPPAVGRSTWRADVAYVPSAENRSHGSTMGVKLRRFCAGTRFRYVFY